MFKRYLEDNGLKKVYMFNIIVKLTYALLGKSQSTHIIIVCTLTLYNALHVSQKFNIPTVLLHIHVYYMPSTVHCTYIYSGVLYLELLAISLSDCTLKQ